MADTDNSSTHWKCSNCQYEWTTYFEEIECPECKCKIIEGY